MPWIELRVETTKAHAEQLESLLFSHGALSVTFQDAGDEPVLEPAPGEIRLWEHLVLTGLFLADADLAPLHLQLNALSETKQVSSVCETSLKDQAWERTCLQDFHPLRVGRRLWICPSWETPPEPDAINLILDPGLAFGTGTHPTTRLCLAWLEAHLLTGETVLDYGCGSGILSLAALLLGAKQVTAIDHDIQAIESTKENARRNAISADRLILGLPETPLPHPVDTVIANILAEPLIQLAPRLSNCLPTGGKLALSGILESQADSVIKAYSPWISLQPYDNSGNWVCLTGFRL